MPNGHKPKPCKLCGVKTLWIVNINFKAVPVCHNCSRAVFIQVAQWYAENDKTEVV